MVKTTARPRPAADRLRKVARTAKVTLYRDEEPLDAHERAVSALDRLVGELETTRARRLAVARAAPAAAAPDAPGTGEAERRAEDAVQADDDTQIAAAKADVDDAAAAVREVELTFVFRSLGRTAWRQIVAANPPTDLETQEWKRQGLDGDPPYEGEGVLRALLEQALVAPALDAADIDSILTGDAWNEQEVMTLFSTALAAQTQVRVPSEGA